MQAENERLVALAALLCLVSKFPFQTEREAVIVVCQVSRKSALQGFKTKFCSNMFLFIFMMREPPMKETALLYNHSRHAQWQRCYINFTATIGFWMTLAILCYPMNL